MYRHVWTKLVAVMAINLATASAVFSQTVSPWTNPGSFPFKGDYSDVCVLHADDLSEEQCKRALLSYEKGECREYFLKEGDVIDVSFTSDRHYQKVLQVTFGDEVALDDPMRRALACDTGRSDGLMLVRPDVCGNWSLMTMARQLPPEMEVASKPSPAFICQSVPAHRHEGNKIFFVSNVNIGGVCNDPHFIPSYLYQEESLEVFGQGTECVANFDETFR